MTRSTKNQARQQADVYGELLMERAVISDIGVEDIRGEKRYSFYIFDKKYPYKVDCSGIQELALVLTSMWSAYSCAYDLLMVE